MANQTNPITSLSGVDVQREETRTTLAYISLGGYIFILILILIIGWWILRQNIEDVLKILTTTASILGGIIGAIIGFYFRGKEE